MTAEPISPLPLEIWMRVIELLNYQCIWKLHRVNRLLHSLAIGRLTHLLRQADDTPGASNSQLSGKGKAVVFAISKLPMLLNNSKIVTALSLQFQGWCAKTWAFEYAPAPRAVFGIWVPYMGFLPTTEIDQTTQFWFSARSVPLLHVSVTSASPMSVEMLDSTIHRLLDHAGAHRVASTKVGEMIPNSGRYLAELASGGAWVDYQVLTQLEEVRASTDGSATAEEPSGEDTNPPASSNRFGIIHALRIRGEVLFDPRAGAQRRTNVLTEYCTP